ncbi:MAG: hypothetical protein PHE73_09250 [Sulfurovaceae bacterium]|nr:hypothetical protein [Sulfurovaceae bacterium]
MSDLMQFKHGEEGSHGVCEEMIKKYGGKVKCCSCTGHKCQTQKPSGEDEKDEFLIYDRPGKIEILSECHPTPKDEEWEEELSISLGRFIQYKPYFRLMPEEHYQELKDFIRQERKKVREETIEELRGQL